MTSNLGYREETRIRWGLDWILKIEACCERRGGTDVTYQRTLRALFTDGPMRMLASSPYVFVRPYTAAQVSCSIVYSKGDDEGDNVQCIA